QRDREGERQAADRGQRQAGVRGHPAWSTRGSQRRQGERPEQARCGRRRRHRRHHVYRGARGRGGGGGPEVGSSEIAASRAAARRGRGGWRISIRPSWTIGLGLRMETERPRPSHRHGGWKGAAVELTGTASGTGGAESGLPPLPARTSAYSARISTRRFSARPSLVSFEATGRALP